MKYGGEQVPCNLKKLTHLILGEATGGKYEAAKKQSNIRIVREAWIHDSVKCGYALIEYDYLFDPATGSPPKKFDFTRFTDVLLSSAEPLRSSSQTSQIHSQSTGQYSVQLNSRVSSQIVTPAATQAPYSNQPSNQLIAETADSERSQKENAQRLHNETVRTQEGCMKPPQPTGKQTYCVKSKSELAKSDNESANPPRRTAFSVLTSSSQRQRPGGPVNVDEELGKLVGQLAGCRSSTFDGCDFHINESIPASTRTLLKRCITLQNGTISASLRQSVSHVIVREELPESERKKLNDELDRFDHTINQVSVKWIIQCSKSSKLQPTIDLNLLSQSSQDQSALNSSITAGRSHLDVANESQSRQSQRPLGRLKKATLGQPVSQALPIREVVPPTRTDDDIFNDYSQDYTEQPANCTAISSQPMDSSRAFSQPQTTADQQRPPCALDLELMSREEKPLYKCVITISSYSVALKEELTKIAQRLGATCQLEFVKNDKPAEEKRRNTHLVCEEASGKKYDRALKWGVHCVNQQWLRKCEELVQRVDEREYPPAQPTDGNTKETSPASSVPSSTTNSASNSQASEMRTNKQSNASQTGSSVRPSTSAINTPIDTAIDSAIDTAIDTAIDRAVDTFAKPLESTLSQGDVMSRFGELRTILNGKSGSTAQSSTLNEHRQTSDLTARTSATEKRHMNQRTNDDSIGEVTSPTGKQQIDILSDDHFNDNPKQHVPIGWNEQRLERFGGGGGGINQTVLSAPVNSTTSVTMLAQRRSEVYSDESMVRNRLIEPDISTFTIREDTPVTQVAFHFSGYSTEEKQAFARELSKIGIKVIHDNSLNFDYLITKENTLIKNELFFVSVATGKWICHPDFYKRTLELGKPPNPVDYEWGSNPEYLRRLDSKFVQLAKACRYWRLKVAETKQFAFHNQRHVVISKSARNYASIIQNGGGKAVAIELDACSREAYDEQLKDVYRKLKNGSLQAEYLLVNIRKKEREQLDLGSLVRPIEAMKVKCLMIDYLSLYLVSGPNLQMQNVLINPETAPPTNLKRMNNSDGSESNPNSKMIKR